MASRGRRYPTWGPVHEQPAVHQQLGVQQPVAGQQAQLAQALNQLLGPQQVPPNQVPVFATPPLLEEEEPDTDEQLAAAEKVVRQIPHVLKYSGEKNDLSWRAWRLHEQNFRTLSPHLKNTSNRFQKTCLMSLLTGRALQSAQSLGPGSAKWRSSRGYDDFLLHLQEMFNPQRESLLVRQEFAQRRQGRDESVTEFLAVKSALFRDGYSAEGRPFCVFRDSVMKGLRSTYVKKCITQAHPQTEQELTDIALKAVSENALLWELGCSDEQGQTKSSGRLSRPFDSSINSMQGRGGSDRGRSRGRGRGAGRGKAPQGGAADSSQVECWSCGKKGHFSRECRSKPNPGKQGVSSTGQQGQGGQGARGGRRGRGRASGRGRGRGGRGGRGNRGGRGGRVRAVDGQGDYDQSGDGELIAEVEEGGQWDSIWDETDD